MDIHTVASARATVEHAAAAVRGARCCDRVRSALVVCSWPDTIQRIAGAKILLASVPPNMGELIGAGVPPDIAGALSDITAMTTTMITALPLIGMAFASDLKETLEVLHCYAYDETPLTWLSWTSTGHYSGYTASYDGEDADAGASLSIVGGSRWWFMAPAR